MTHTHTIGSRIGHGMVAGGTRWEATGLLNTGKRLTSTFVSTRSTTTGNRIARPSFLRMDLEDLHRGAFNEMSARIENLPEDSTLVELYDRLLDRIEAVHGAPLCSEVLGLLWASRRGLSICEMAAISKCRRDDVDDLCAALTSHLIKRNGLLAFAHPGLRAAVQNRYLTESTRLSLHSRIALHFAGATHDSRRVEELPWQYAACGAWGDLKQVLVTPETLTALAVNAEGCAELAGYWKAIEGGHDVVVEYIAMLDQAESSTTAEGLDEMATAVMRLMSEIGREDGVDAVRARCLHARRRASSIHRPRIAVSRRIREGVERFPVPMQATYAIGIRG